MIITHLADRYGRRGLWLILMGAMWILFGVGVLLSPVEARPGVLYEMIPAVYRAPVWWITGAIAIWQGTRGRVLDDSPGHVALYVMPAVRLVSFAVSGITYGLTWALVQAGWLNQTAGWAGGWYAALVWSFISLMLAVGASWPNPVPPIPRPPTTPGAPDA